MFQFQKVQLVDSPLELLLYEFMKFQFQKVQLVGSTQL